MTALARWFGVPTLLVSLGAAGLVPAAAAPAGADPDSSAVGSTCMGPGRVALTVSPSDTEGSVDLELRATGLADGTRWRGALDASDATGADGRNFRRVAADGGWTVRATVSEPAPGPETSFAGIAFSRRYSTCLVFIYPRPTTAVSFCAKNIAALLLARYRAADDRLVVRFVALAKPGSRWHVELRATTAESAQAVAVGLTAGPRGWLRARTSLRGFDDPRLSVVATRPSGGRCALHLDPVDVTAAPPPAIRALLDRARDRSRTISAPRGLAR
jgi:hypothetical protein